MLLTSLEDAKAGLEGRAEEHVRTGSLSSRALERRGEAGVLWRQGSYYALEIALGKLRPKRYREVLDTAFVFRPSARQRRTWWDRYKVEHAALIEEALEALSELMPVRIFVPKDVRDNWFDYQAEIRKRKRAS